MELLHHTSFAISVLGALIIAYGVLIGLLRFMRSEVHAMHGVKVDTERRDLRHMLGYYLLLGLEFLFAADIIDTLMERTLNGFNDILVLGITIVICTIVSWSLNAELKVAPADKN